MFRNLHCYFYFKIFIRELDATLIYHCAILSSTLYLPLNIPLRYLFLRNFHFDLIFILSLKKELHFGIDSPRSKTIFSRAIQVKTNLPITEVDKQCKWPPNYSENAKIFRVVIGVSGCYWTGKSL